MDPEPAQPKPTNYRPWLTAITVLLALNLLLAIAPAIGLGDIHRPTFDYKVTCPPDSNFLANATNMGAHGWELASARRATGTDSTSPSCYEIIWKRQA